MMTANDLINLSPLITLAVTAIVIMLVTAVKRNHVLTVTLTLIGIATAIGLLFVISPPAPQQVMSLLVADGYSQFFMALIFATSFAVALLSHGYLEKQDEQREEFYMMLLLAALGSAVLAGSTHFVSFLLGLEILSVSLYVLIGYLRAKERSVEAAVKYLILAAASAAFLFFGMALLYADLGTMEFSRIASVIKTGNVHPFLLLTGTSLITVGVGFKLAVVPFHMWTPDVYEGAPAPVTAFIATVSKGAVFALLLRFVQTGNLLSQGGSLFYWFAIVAVASMFAGNLLALLQTNVKRILAYSSIAHLGYLLIAFLAGGSTGVAAVSYYLTAYFVTTLIAFGVITVLSGKERDADAMTDYEGLFWQRPWLALAFAASLLSLAGIPLTAGFVAKFYIVAAGINSALWWLVVVLVVNSAIGLFYYLRIIVAMYRDAKREVPLPSVSLGGKIALGALTVLLIWLGVYPVTLIRTIQASAAMLVK
jgi:NADH-quinone oxidoreductase subunit N